MVVFLEVGEDDYVISWGSDGGDVSIELEEDHDFFTTDVRAWKYVDGDLVFDEEKQQQIAGEYEREQSKPTEIERLEDALLELAMMTMNGE